jgi:hypothetical protein
VQIWTKVEIFPKVPNIFDPKSEVNLKAEDILYVWKALPKLTLFQAIFRDIHPKI